jgi:hypothetical protein
LEKIRQCSAALSNDQLVRLGSIVVTMAERLADSVDCGVDASLEGTKRLEQEFSRVWRTLNNNDTNDRLPGKDHAPSESGFGLASREVEGDRPGASLAGGRSSALCGRPAGRDRLRHIAFDG